MRLIHLILYIYSYFISKFIYIYFFYKYIIFYILKVIFFKNTFIIIKIIKKKF